MSLKDLSIDEVDALLEGHPFPYDYTYTDYRTNKPVRNVGESFGWDHVYSAIAYNGAVLSVPGLGNVTHLDEHGGEGQGDQYWFIFEVTDGETTRVFKRDGWYASHDGGYYDGPTTEVKAVQKTIMVWE